MKRYRWLVFFAILFLARSGVTAQFDSSAFDALVEQALLQNAQGDAALQQSVLDSALVHYAEARHTVNELFFLLVATKNGDSTGSNWVTAKWDSVMQLMQVPLNPADTDSVGTMIFREERAANWCLTVLADGDSTQISTLFSDLNRILQKDARAQWKNFFGKIYYAVRLELSQGRLNRTLGFPAAQPLLTKQSREFLKNYWQYKKQVLQE